MSDGVAARQMPALPHPLRRPLGAVAVLAALVVVVLAAIYAGEDAAGTADRGARSAVLDALPGARSDALTVDFAGEPLVLAALVILLCATCLILRRWRLAVLAFVGIGLAGAVTTLLKPVAGRTINGENLSYPSGHTASATALALVLALLVVGVLRVGTMAAVMLVVAAAVVAGAAMAWSQITLNAHYPTDALGGFCTALTVVPGAAWAIDRLGDWWESRIGHRT